MKKLILCLVIGLLVNNPNAYSQEVSGKVYISGFSKVGTIKELTQVKLFKILKEINIK